MKNNSCWNRLSVIAFVVLSFYGFACFADESEPARKSFSFSELGQKATEKADSNSLGIKAVDNGAEIVCKLQALEASVTPSGISIRSTSSTEGAGAFSMKVAELGRAGQRLSQDSSEVNVKVSKDCVQIVRPNLVEEYTVSGDGIRQDFIVSKRPEGSGELVLAIGLGGATAELSSSGLKIRLSETGREFAYSKLLVIDAAGKKLPAEFKINSPSQFIVSVDDSGAVYPVRIDPTISDANWISMGAVSGTDSSVSSLVFDSSGNLYAGGMFMSAGGVTVNHVAKWNGSTWSDLGNGMDGGTVSALAFDSYGNLYAGGDFVTAGGDYITEGVTVNYIAKWDGISWSALGTGMDASVYALVFDSSGNLYVGGEFSTAGGGSVNGIAKWDGISWSSLGTGMEGGVYALAFDSSGNLYAGGGFYTAGGVSVSNIAKWDGLEWGALGTGTEGRVQALAFDSTGNLYAGGEFYNADSVMYGVAKWNGMEWSTLGTGTEGIVSAIVCDSSGNLYAGGDFTNAGGVTVNLIAKWNGSSWSALETGMKGYYVQVLALGPTGTIYAGGDFYTAGAASANNIAKWNSSAWSSLGIAGIDFIVSALACDSSGNLYVGGGGGLSGNNIAKWSGSSWSALGTGMKKDNIYESAGVNSLVLDSSGNLFAGGDFTSADGVSANYIAKWNGSTWSALGTGIGWGSYHPTVFALACDSFGNIYAGGGFSTAGGVTANRIAKWDGFAWSALGSGLNNWVSALAFDSSGNLYAGGEFTAAGGIAVNRIAKWDGFTWSALGTGMMGGSYPNVSTLACDSSGNLYAGGYFSTAGGVSAINIAKWNGISWSALGTGIEGGGYPSISAIAFDSHGNLYAGGYFSTAGGVSANYIAKWNGFSWSALGTGIGRSDPTVSALACDSFGNLYVGGMFTTAGGKASPNLAKCIISDSAVQITAIDVITGTARVGSVLTAGALTPAGATASYQWKLCTAIDGAYASIDGATLNTYTPIAWDENKFIKVVATGTGNYYGTVTSVATAAVKAASTSPVTAIGAITGTSRVGSVLTAGALSPAGATASYRWAVCSTVDGIYSNIVGATLKTYTPVAGDAAKFLKVTATGTGNYYGTVTSGATAAVAAAVTTPITAIAAITGTAKVGSLLTAGALKPTGATASYRWTICETVDGTYANIPEATLNTYSPVAGDVNKFIKVVATGTGSYSGTVTSVATVAVEAAVTTPLTAIAAITGTAKVGSVLTAGVLTPAGATASYQWKICGTAGGKYVNIAGATSNTYMPGLGDVKKFIMVVATGTGNYSGTVTSVATAAIAPGTMPITGIGAITPAPPQVGSVLTAGTLIPQIATVTYQWTISETADGSYVNIAKATAKTYKPAAGDLNKFLKVVATGKGGYSGTVISAATAAVTTPLKSIAAITGTAKIGSILSAGALTPAGATVSYQWKTAAKAAGPYNDIEGEILNTYTPVPDDAKQFIKVEATGTDSYSGTVISAATKAIPTLITSVGITGAAKVGSALTAGAFTPAGATATYQWTVSDAEDGDYVNIAKAKAKTYTPVAGDLNRFLKVVATGTVAYSGTVTSPATAAVTMPIKTIGAITPKAKVGVLLTAGALTPVEATATYQWKIAAKAAGPYVSIDGETSNTYTPVPGDAKQFIKVEATGMDSYSGTVMSTPTVAVAAATFTVSSASFPNGDPIPDMYANYLYGDNISPELSWINVPTGTQSFAVTCIDPAAGKWVHWMVIDIPADITGLAEGASLNDMPEDSIELNNSFYGLNLGEKYGYGYGGPEPPSGKHTYVFTVYALSVTSVNASGKISEAAFLKLVSGKILAKTQWTGTFTR